MATCRASLIAVGLLLLLGGIAKAETITIGAADRGWYRQDSSNTGFHNPTVDNYLTGRYTEDVDPAEYRSFFVFNVPEDLPANIASAKLELNTLYVYGDSATYQLCSFPTSSISDLVAGGSNLDTIFDKLKSGTVYDTYDITVDDAHMYIQIPLNSAFLSDIKGAAGGQIAIGSALTALGADDQYVFYYEDAKPPFTSSLILEVPEPGAFVLLLIAAASIFALPRRRRRV